MSRLLACDDISSRSNYKDKGALVKTIYKYMLVTIQSTKMSEFGIICGSSRKGRLRGQNPVDYWNTYRLHLVTFSGNGGDA